MLKIGNVNFFFNIYDFFKILDFFENGSSTSPPGGNMVDGLPPASSTGAAAG